MVKAIFRLISRNETKGAQRATEEELLQEVVDELKDVFELDLAAIKDPVEARDEDFKIKYPQFFKRVALEADSFKKKAGYRQICCLPAFALGLVMASRIPSHYTHAHWFNLKSLTDMINVHGTVSDSDPNTSHPIPTFISMQFISEFIVESVEYLERIANPQKPPLGFAEIERKKNDFDAPGAVLESVRASLKGMEVAFAAPGNLSSWTPELLDDIDTCFIRNYLGEEGEPVPSLFFPNCPDNLNRFMAYCSEVDQAIRTHYLTAPTYAREYFLYYSIWQMQDWPFPVPLGT